MNKYSIVKMIGAGGEAKALLVKKIGTDNLFVMKQRYFQNLEQANEGLNEAVSLAKIINSHIVKFEDVFIIFKDNIFSLCIVMEYCDGGDLMDFLFNVIMDKSGGLSITNSSSSSNEGEETGQNPFQKFIATLKPAYSPTTSTDSTTSGTCSNTSSSFLGIPVTSPTSHPYSPILNRNHEVITVDSSIDNIMESDEIMDASTISSSSDASCYSIPSDKNISLYLASSPPPTTANSLNSNTVASSTTTTVVNSPSSNTTTTTTTVITTSTNNSKKKSGNFTNQLAGKSKSSTPSSDSSTSIFKLQLPKKVLYQWLFQISMGVQAIHSHNFIHRDLKSENIFLNNYQVKIGDFGLATRCDATSAAYGVAGTYYYSAPEVLSNKNYGKSADIFSLGCIFYEMVTLHLLPISKRCFGDEINKGTFNKAHLLAEFPSEFSALGDLIIEMLNPISSARPTIDSIVCSKVFEKIRRDSLHSSPSSGSTSSANMALLTSDIPSVGGFRRQLAPADFNDTCKTLAESFLGEARFNYVSGVFSKKETTVKKASSVDPLVRKYFFQNIVKGYIGNDKFMLWGFNNSENQLKGVACWHLPEKKKFGVIKFILAAASMLPKIGISVIKRMGNVSGAVDKCVKRAGEVSNAYLLSYIGIEKEYRHKGVGQYILQPVLEWADCTNKKCMTIVFEKRSLPFFIKLGFEVIVEEKLALPGFDAIYILSRKPKPK